MKKVVLTLILLLISVQAYAFTEHTAPDGFMVFVQVKDIKTINLWVGDFRYPTELIVLEVANKSLLSAKTFTFRDNKFSDFEDQFVMFDKMVNTGGFFVTLNNQVMKIQNNYTGNIYKLTWLGSWYSTMAVWQFTYWDSWLSEGYNFTDYMGKQPIYTAPREGEDG